MILICDQRFTVRRDERGHVRGLPPADKAAHDIHYFSNHIPIAKTIPGLHPRYRR